jgi:arylsulfatase A-like enzyme
VLIAQRPIFLFFDSFDPHEPWTPPPEFDRYTDPGYKGKLPTLLDACDRGRSPGPGNNVEAMHGRSLMPLIRGEVACVREAIITGYHESVERCIRDQTWSYVRRPEGQPDELYNLVEDPGERHNVIDEHPEVAQRLAAMFGSLYLKEVSAVKGIQGRYEVADSAAG